MYSYSVIFIIVVKKNRQLLILALLTATKFIMIGYLQLFLRLLNINYIIPFNLNIKRIYKIKFHYKK